MPTKLATRTPKYMAQYGRTLNAAYRFERIQNEVKGEQQRVQYLDSLIGQERQTLAALQQGFQTPPVSMEAATAVLSDTALAGIAAGVDLATKAAATKAATTLTKDDLKNLGAAAQSGAAAYLGEAEGLLIGATKDKKKAVLADAKGRLSPEDYAKLEARSKETGDKKLPGQSKAQRDAAAQRAEAVQAGLEAAYFAGPSGIRGGFEGMAAASKRKLTASELRAQGLAAEADALEKSGFATQDAALDAALQVVRETGDPAAAPAYARDIYIEARNKQAYRNDQRADFEQEVLDSRKRLAQLETERRKITSAYDDPEQEVIRRELAARGYTFEDRAGENAWKNKYVQYQNTPYYSILLDADRRVDAAKAKGEPLAPSTKAQNMAATLVMQYRRTETPHTLDTIRDQLEKANDLSTDDINDALGFIVAYQELGGDKQDPEAIKARAKLDEQERKAEEAQRMRAQAIEAEAQRARKVTQDLEAKQVRAVEELRAAQAALNAPSAKAAEMIRPRVEAEAQLSQERLDMAKEYARLRSLGLAADEARRLTLDRVPAPAPAMSPNEVDALRGEALKGFVAPQERPAAQTGVLMGEDFVLERAGRIEAARGRPQDYVPSPPASRLYDDVSAAPLEEELKFGGGVVTVPTPAVEAAPPAAPPRARPAARQSRREAEQLRQMLKNKMFEVGSAQYKAALARILELEEG